jgi:hypothetical protein
MTASLICGSCHNHFLPNRMVYEKKKDLIENRSALKSVIGIYFKSIICSAPDYDQTIAFWPIFHRMGMAFGWRLALADDLLPAVRENIPRFKEQFIKVIITLGHIILPAE